MLFDKLLKPAIFIMNKLPFKIKIMTSMSILSLLFIAPAYIILSNYVNTSNIYKNQLIGLKYIKRIQDIILVTQEHRGFTNNYLQGDAKFKNDIIKKEKLLKHNLLKLLDFDRSSLNILSQNKNYVEAISKIDIIKLKNISKNASSDSLFEKHTSIIVSFADTIKDISYLTSFSEGHDLKINYIAKLLQQKLLKLQEYTAVMRGKVSRYFIKQDISQNEIQELLLIYALTQRHKADLLDNDALIGMDNYLRVKKKIKLISYRLQELLEVVNKQILMDKKLMYNGQDFFKQATTVIALQNELFKLLSVEYLNIIRSIQNKINFDMSLLILGFLSIILGASYVFTAFFRSVKGSLEKLQSASEMIASGDRNIYLKPDTNDEIGEALLAFNQMSQTLEKNISFLNGYKIAIDETSIVSKTDKKGIITYVNKLFCQISGYTKSELIGYPHNKVRHRDMSKDVFKQMWKKIKDKKIWKGVIKNRKKNGDYFIVDATVIPLLDSKGDIIEYIAIRHDITELENSKKEIQRQKIDLLTKLPNRSKLIDDLKIAKKPILFYLNIDNFANLNDFYGSKIGDVTLIYIANILRKIQKSAGAKLYRLHADEFILYFEKAELIEKQYKYIFQEIINYVEQQTIDCNGQSCVSITMSGGVVFYGEDKNYDNLINYANIARKFAKSKNKKFLLFTQEMRKEDDYADNIAWINKIKEAIKQKRIVAFFQPIIDNTTGAITKYESLVRMIDKDGKVISPFFFLDISKKAKLYRQITQIVIDEAFSMSKMKPQLDISVNIEIEDITDSNTITYIYDKLSKHPYADHIILEITESQEIKNYIIVQEFIKKVKSYGAQIAIDDFGSGYSNFEEILTLDADFIKIDGSLIKNIDTNRNSRIITETIINFSKKLGCKTIVEYVHNKEIYDIVRELGADYSQGFYLGEPKLETVSIEHAISNNTKSNIINTLKIKNESYSMK